MNFNKLYAICCGLSALTIFITYIFVYYKNLEGFTSNLQYVVLAISTAAFIASLAVLAKNAKLLFSKDYIYTTVILIFISLLSMWYNQYLFFMI